PKGQIRGVAWSPDGTRVVFHRRTANPSRGMRPTFSRLPGYELNLSASLPAFSPSGKEYLTNSAPIANPRGSSIRVTSVGTGQSRILYEDKNRNVLAGAWSPAGDRVVFGVGTFPAFFAGFTTLFLKPDDRV